MAASILQRATGIALYGGTLLLTLWLASAAWSEAAFGIMHGVMGSFFGVLILVAYSWALSFHLLNGIKFLFADAGLGFDKTDITRNAWAVFIGSGLLTALIWIGVALSKGTA